MGFKSVINGYTTWGNVRLVKGDCETKDIIQGITQGYRMKVLLQGKMYTQLQDVHTTNDKWFIRIHVLFIQPYDLYQHLIEIQHSV